MRSIRAGDRYGAAIRPSAAILEWIEVWYNPRRRHTSIDDRSSVEYGRLYTAASDAA